MDMGKKVIPLLGWSAAIALTACLVTGVIPLSRIRELGLPGLAILSLASGAAVEFAGPGYVAVFAFALAYPPWLVGIVAGISTAAGEMTKYALGRRSQGILPPVVRSLLDKTASTSLLKFFLRRPAVTLFALAVIPNPFFDPLIVLAGLRMCSMGPTTIAVLFGKTLRCILLAYLPRLHALHFAAFTPEIVSMLHTLIAVVLGTMILGVIHWLYDFFAHDEPGGFVLHMTVFAFVSQLAVGLALAPKGFSTDYVVVLLCILLCLMLQVVAFRSQRRATQRHLREVLERIAREGHGDAAASWAEMADDLIGIDFYPQLFRVLGESNPRDARKRRFLRLLPADRFDLSQLGSEQYRVYALDVPEDSRRWRWRAHAFLGSFAWIIHLSYLAALVFAAPPTPR